MVCQHSALTSIGLVFNINGRIHPDTQTELDLLQKQYKFDYLVGSVHHVFEIPIDFDLKTFEKAEMKAGSTDLLFQAYFDAQYQMLLHVKPKVVGHFDLIFQFRFTESLDLSEAVWSKILRNIQTIVSIDALVELNSRGFKKALNSPYPTERIAKEMVQQGVKFCFSDDSHGPVDVGFEYDRLKLYAKGLGITKVYEPFGQSYGI